MFRNEHCKGQDQLFWLQRLMACLSLQVDTELCRLFKQFIADFRPLLHPEQSSDYLFLVGVLARNSREYRPAT